MMSSMKLSYIAEEINGVCHGDAEFSHVCTDTRSLQAGDLFLALTGENFNGNKFIAEAVKQGASAAVVSEGTNAAIPYVQTKDPRLAYGLIARINRREFNKPIIALTGSAGKTTTKEMIAAILSQGGDVLATQGNLNNEIGVPLTLLALSPKHDAAVIEMGASGKGDIRYLTQFAEPTVAVVTNAMPAHIEGFGSLDNVAITKGEIFESLNGGVAVINYDDAYYEQWREQASNATIVTFSQLNSSADYYAENIQLNNNGVTHFNLVTPQGCVAISLPLLGEHNIGNAIAAAAAAQAVGASLIDIQHGLSAIEPVSGRLKTYSLPHLTLIDDSYNANPGAVKAAINTLSQFSGSRCLVLGTMGELGADAELLHIDVAKYAKQQGIEELLVVGEYGDVMATHFGEHSKSFASMEILLAELNQDVKADVLLVKGSRSAGMERIVNSLIKNSEKGNS